MRWTPIRRVGDRGIDALLGHDFLSAHYTEVAVAILLKMIFLVHFSSNSGLDNVFACSYSQFRVVPVGTANIE